MLVIIHSHFILIQIATTISLGVMTLAKTNPSLSVGETGFESFQTSASSFRSMLFTNKPVPNSGFALITQKCALHVKENSCIGNKELSQCTWNFLTFLQSFDLVLLFQKAV